MESVADVTEPSDTRCSSNFLGYSTFVFMIVRSWIETSAGGFNVDFDSYEMLPLPLGKVVVKTNKICECWWSMILVLFSFVDWRGIGMWLFFFFSTR